MSADIAYLDTKDRFLARVDTITDILSGAEPGAARHHIRTR